MDDLVIRLNEFFTTSIDNPFMGSINTISEYFAENIKFGHCKLKLIAALLITGRALADIINF